MAAKVRQVITITEESWKGDPRRVVKALGDVLDGNEGQASGLKVETTDTRYVSYKKVTAKVTITREVY